MAFITTNKIEDFKVGDRGTYPHDDFRIWWMVCGNKSKDRENGEYTAMSFSVFLSWVAQFTDKPLINKGYVVISTGGEYLIALYIHDDYYGLIKLSNRG